MSRTIPGAAEPGFDDSDWRYVTVPHDWMIENRPDSASPSGRPGGFHAGGIAWYRNTFHVEDRADRQLLFLCFEGVSMHSDVFINGHLLGHHADAYLGFSHDIGPWIRTDTANVIAVRTDCSQLPVDRWYTGGGIHRHVRLIAKEPLHFPLRGTVVRSEIDSTRQALLTVDLEVANLGKRDERFDLLVDVVDSQGRLVADGRSSEFLAGGDSATLRKELRIEQPTLWSPETPDLYTVNCYLMDGNRRIDHQQITHGIRTVAWDPQQGLVLNGNPVFMKGVCLHHDGGPLGAAVPQSTWRRRLENLKSLGVNALRLAHRPHSPELLDLCDEMGFLVVDELYDKWEEPWPDSKEIRDFPDRWKADVAAFVQRDRNHPSVVLWSVGNEVMEQLADPEKAVEWYERLIEEVRAQDPDREVTCALHPGYPDRGNEIPSRMMQLSSVVSYNYRSDSFRVWHERYPDLVFLASETKMYRTDRVADYQIIDFSKNSWNNMQPPVAGHFVWAGIDYLGESVGWPDRGWRHGLLETTGAIKPHAWYIGSRYRDDPMVKLTVKDELLADSLNRWKTWQSSWAGAPLADHWSFPDGSGEKEIVIFTNCDSVELFLNGHSEGIMKQDAFPDRVIKTRLVYEPGTLSVRAFCASSRGRKGTVSDSLVTAGNPHALRLAADRKEVTGAGNRVVHIEASVVDSLGNRDPHGRQQVSYQVEGPGRIRAIDNGDLADHSLPSNKEREMRQGRQLLILQAGTEPGDIILNASAEGLQPSSVKIKSK
ncbi:MAG: glycoside hydrolase family 2 TIM barrel-domain containing protein [Bacteroidales bacterium]